MTATPPEVYAKAVPIGEPYRDADGHLRCDTGAVCSRCDAPWDGHDYRACANNNRGETA